MARELFEVSCPCCQSTLKIDGEVRAVISHAEPVKKPIIEDLAAEVAKLKGAPGRREEAFQKSFAAEKNQGQVLNRKFETSGRSRAISTFDSSFETDRAEEVAGDLAGGPVLPVQFVIEAAHGFARDASG
jgi:hypothetical protein